MNTNGRLIGLFSLSQAGQIGAIYCAKLMALEPVGKLWEYLLTPYIMWLVFALVSCLVIQAFCWQQVLKQAPLSRVYPATAVQFPLLAVMGWWLFAEALTLAKCLGIVMVMVGVYLLLSDSPVKSTGEHHVTDD